MRAFSSARTCVLLPVGAETQPRYRSSPGAAERTLQRTARQPGRFLARATTALLLGALLASGTAWAQETVIPLETLPLSATTGEKPQSKVWHHDGRWWAVLPSSAVTPSGTWLWRLGVDYRWINLLHLSSSTSSKADTLAVGDVTHVLLHQNSSELVSVEYVPDAQTYTSWTGRPGPTAISLAGSETATIDLDSTGRMWLATDSGSDILVYYSDHPYSTFEGPIVLADNVTTDDISVVTALPVPNPPRVGVLWSNQTAQRFGFRVHVDGTDPMLWLPDEVPAEQSALQVGTGMADDHLNVTVASDGTLYAGVKTSYDTSSFARIALLVRRPDGQWDDLYFVDDKGTRGIVLVNEDADLLRVVYTGDGDTDIVFRDSLLSAIGFGARETLMFGTLNDATSMKGTWVDDVVVLAAGSGALISRSGVSTTSTTSTTTTTTTPSTTAPTSSTTATTWSTTSTSPSTTATIPSTSSTTSTTIPTDPCEDAPIGLTFWPVECRLDALTARVAGASELRELRAKLLGRLAKATARLRHAEALCGEASRSRPREALQPVIRKLSKFRGTLASRQARGLPEALRNELRAAAAALRDDVRVLRESVLCPRDAPAG